MQHRTTGVIRKLVYELKNTEYLPFREALVITRNKWKEVKKEEIEQQRDFAVRPPGPRPGQAPPIPKPVTRTPQPPCMVSSPSSHQEEEGIEVDQGEQVSPTDSPVACGCGTPHKRTTAERKHKKKKRCGIPHKRLTAERKHNKKKRHVTPHKRTTAERKHNKKKRRVTVQTVSAASLPDCSEGKDKPHSPKSPPVQESVKLIWTTISKLQQKLAKTSPQAARIMDGVFVMLQKVIDIANDAE